MPSGYFRPEAVVTFRQVLRTSGLLLALPPEEVKSLLLMLTFVTPNGWCQPAVQQLADAMRVSEAKVRARMQRLQDFQWQGQPLVIEIKRDSGMDGFALSPAVIALQAALEWLPETAPSLPTSRRDEIIARSRSLYARPRAEVEAMIAEQMGWKEQGDGPEAQLRRKLMGVAGLRREQIDLLIAQFPHERIEQQLDWLPHRNAKSPARFLMAAIENDYDPPPAIRIRQALMQTEGQQAGISEGDVLNPLSAAKSISLENPVISHEPGETEPGAGGDVRMLAESQLEIPSLEMSKLDMPEAEATHEE